MKTRRWIIGALAVLVSSLATHAQNPILEVDFLDQPIQIAASDVSFAWLHINNTSTLEADNIEVAVISDSLELVSAQPLEVLDAFSSTSLEVQLALPDGASPDGGTATFDVSYTYCIGELCFQIFEEVSLAFEVVEPDVLPVDPDPPFDPIGQDPPARLVGAVALPVVLAAMLVVALITGTRIGRRWWTLGLLVIVLGVGMGVGIALKQDQQAQSIGAVLCTSCVGIEEAPHHDPVLSDSARARVLAVSEEIELLFFSAVWCHACPFAKSMVDQVTSLNPMISFRVIDVDEDRDAANAHGVVQSARTIVPAIVRVGVADVLFGIEDLEERLLELLEATL